MSTCACPPSKATEQGKPVLLAISCRSGLITCFKKYLNHIPVVSGARRRFHTTKRHHNLNNLPSLKHTLLCDTPLFVGLWNCQSAVNKADFITAYAKHLSLDILALTETWIKPENNATLSALWKGPAYFQQMEINGLYLYSAVLV